MQEFEGEYDIPEKYTGRYAFDKSEVSNTVGIFFLQIGAVCIHITVVRAIQTLVNVCSGQIYILVPQRSLQCVHLPVQLGAL